MKFFKRVSTVYYRFGTDDHFTAWVRVFRLGWMTAEKKKTSTIMPGETVKLLRVYSSSALLLFLLLVLIPSRLLNGEV